MSRARYYNGLGDNTQNPIINKLIKDAVPQLISEIKPQIRPVVQTIIDEVKPHINEAIRNSQPIIKGIRAQIHTGFTMANISLWMTGGILLMSLLSLIVLIQIYRSR